MTIKNSFDYDWKNNHSTPKIVNKIVKILKKLKSLQNFTHIDVGCGNGEITKKICHFFKFTIAVDLSKQAITFAKKNNFKNIKFLHSSMDYFINQNKKFNFVSVIEVIEHQYDPFIFLKKLHSITSKNGYVLITTPYHGYLKNILISLMGCMDRHFTALWKHGHIKFFSVKTLKELVLTKKFKSNGKILKYNFEIKSIHFAGRFYPFSRSMIFLLKKK